MVRKVKNLDRLAKKSLGCFILGFKQKSSNFVGH
jgi:hypothetical protein